MLNTQQHDGKVKINMMAVKTKHHVLWAVRVSSNLHLHRQTLLLELDLYLFVFPNIVRKGGWHSRLHLFLKPIDK